MVDASPTPCVGATCKCGEDAYYSFQDGAKTELIPFAGYTVLPLKEQFSARIDGMFLQSIVDTSVELEKDAGFWRPGFYSGDTLDCKVSQLHCSSNAN